MWWRLLKILLAVGIYGTAVEPRIVQRVDIAAAIPNLPPAWEGKQIAVFADLQVGMWWANTDAARRLVSTVVQTHPAAVLIAGDFVYEADSSVDTQMQEVVDILRPILADSIPVYAVLGNHDYSLMNEHSEQENHVAHLVRVALERAGVQMMDNKVMAFPPRSGVASEAPFYLVGIGEKWAKNDRTAETMAKLPAGAPRLVFMHDPDSFATIPAGQAPMTIAAHTHGMQLGIPYVSDYLWRHYFSDAGSGVAGWIDNFGQQGNKLYITRGVGFSIVPARINAFPELTVLTLTRAETTP
jgi:predicted MPP superfamily phosphohydrolase